MYDMKKSYFIENILTISFKVYGLFSHCIDIFKKLKNKVN